VPAIPPPVITPVPVPTLSGPAATYRTSPVQRSVRMKRARLLGKVTSICRGC
jgi:hypothetical protein